MLQYGIASSYICIKKRMKILKYKSKRIVCLANSYGRHRSLIIPQADCIIHCGDACTDGNLSQLKDFFEWFSSLNIKRKMFVAGEQDLAVTGQPEHVREMIPPGVTFLENELVDFDGITYYGLAARPLMPEKLPIPMYVDVLITHGPPAGILDGGKGCPVLLQTLKELDPTIHIFGHTKLKGRKSLKVKGQQFYNVVSKEAMIQV